MLSINQASKIDPTLDDLSDEELQKALDDLYEIADLALDCWLDKKGGSKFPKGLLPD